MNAVDPVMLLKDMAVSFEDLNTTAGIKQLDDYLLTHSYIST